MMSKKCKYALKALLRLSRGYGEGYILISEIAQGERIPRKFLEAILLDLKNAGYLHSKQGAGGGYYLIKPPDEITVSEIYRHFDGAIALVPCVSQKYYHKCEDCVDEQTCSLKRAFAEVREKTYELMSHQTMATLLATEADLKSGISPT